MKIKNIIKTTIENLSQDELLEIYTCVNKDDLIKLHHSIGQNIRNDLNLWYDELIQSEFKKQLNIDHPDDISMYIIETIWEDIKKEQSQLKDILWNI